MSSVDSRSTVLFFQRRPASGSTSDVQQRGISIRVFNIDLWFSLDACVVLSGKCVAVVVLEAPTPEWGQQGHVLIGTPGKYCELLKKMIIDVDEVKVLVLDEATNQGEIFDTLPCPHVCARP